LAEGNAVGPRTGYLVVGISAFVAHAGVEDGAFARLDAAGPRAFILWQAWAVGLAVGKILERGRPTRIPVLA
jgi:hypothetical protein